MSKLSLDGYHFTDIYLGTNGTGHVYSEGASLKFGDEYLLVSGNGKVKKLMESAIAGERELLDSFKHFQAFSLLDDEVEVTINRENNEFYTVIEVGDQIYRDALDGIAVSAIPNSTLQASEEIFENKNHFENRVMDAYPGDYQEHKTPKNPDIEFVELDDEEFSTVRFLEFDEKSHELAENGRHGFPKQEDIGMEVEGLEETVHNVMAGERLEKEIRKETGYGMEGINPEVLDHWFIDNFTAIALDQIPDVHVRADLQPHQTGDRLNGLETNYFITNSYLSSNGEDWIQVPMSTVPRPAAEYFPAMNDELEVRIREEPVTEGELVVDGFDDEEPDVSDGIQ